MVVFLLTIAIALFGLSDYPFLGLSFELYIIEALRIAVVVYSAVTLVILNRSSNYRSYDRALFAYLLYLLKVMKKREPNSLSNYL